MTQEKNKFNIILSENVEAINNLCFEGICNQAFEKKSLEKIEKFALELIKQEQVIGGLVALTVYGGLYISLLWINPNYHRLGLGSMLIKKAWEIGRLKKCRFTTLCTMDFEAKPFYEKLGYVLEFERHGYDNNSILYYLRKDL